MAFPDKLKKLREEHKFTQVDLAKKLGVTQRTISYYETGKGQPSMDAVNSLAKIFNVSLDYLLSDYEDSEAKTKAIIDKLRNDTKNNILVWNPADEANIYVGSDEKGELYDTIYSLFDVKSFNQYHLSKIDYKRSYFAPYKKGGYFLAFIPSLADMVNINTIVLFAYHKMKFYLISENSSMRQIEELYSEVKVQCSGIDEFLNEYLRDSSISAE